MNSGTEKNIQNICDNYSSVAFSWDTYMQDLDQERKKRKKDVQKMEQEPICLDEDASKAPDGRFYTEIGSAHIEGFLKKGEGELLYVFFDGARTRNQGRDLAPVPNFSRWSWDVHTTGSVLSLEDPMYYRYEKCKLGWFYGTDEEDYRKDCAQCIDKIASLLGIKRKNVVLYGSSGGGTAAIGVSVHLPGCMTVAINPQLNLNEYEYSREFEEVTGVKIRNIQDIFNRNDACALIQNNPKGNYLIVVNVRSQADFKIHLRSLCEYLDIIPCYGIRRKGNVCTWVYNAVGAPSEHTSLETPALFHAIEFLVLCVRDNADLSEMEGLYRLFNEFWYDHYYQLKKNRKQNNKHSKEIKNIRIELEKAQQENELLKKQLKEISGHGIKGKITRYLHG